MDVHPVDDFRMLGFAASFANPIGLLISPLLLIVLFSFLVFRGRLERETFLNCLHAILGYRYFIVERRLRKRVRRGSIAVVSEGFGLLKGLGRVLSSPLHKLGLGFRLRCNCRWASAIQGRS